MSFDRDRIQSIFHRAACKPPEDREAFVRAKCGDDARVFDEVCSLLAAVDENDLDAGTACESDTIRLSDTPRQLQLNLETAQQAVGDRYQIEQLLGTGGMGQVFAAMDTRLERRVAVKFIGDALVESARGKLLKEARAMAGLRHPSICPVHEVVTDAPAPYIVMGWIDGVPLDRWWRTLDLDARTLLLERVVEAVAEVHSEGLLHLDIKPSNILVDRSGTPVLVDFGLACATDGRLGQGKGGTPGYAGPEQFDSGQEVGPAADVHALGTLLYLAITNQLPWQADSAQEMVAKSANEEPPMPEVLAPGAAWPLQRITLAAIEQDASRRYSDARAMREDFIRFRRGDTVVARPSWLVNRFHDRVRQRQEETGLWFRQGFVTSREAELLDRIYGRMQRPESHWIVDSRRLTISQVLLYLGGWLVVLAMTIGAGFSWEALEEEPSLRYLIPAAMCICVATLGVVFRRLNHARIALAYLFTACLLIPITVLLFLIEQEWFGEWGGRPVLRVLLGVWTGVSNVQLLICGTALMLAAGAGRAYLRANAFAPLVVIGATVVVISGWGSLGLLERESWSWALFGVVLVVLGGIFVAVGIPLNWRQQRLDRLVSPNSDRLYDAWAPLSGGVLLCVIGLTLMAWNRPSYYLPGLLGMDPDLREEGMFIISDRARATAFIINGLVLLAVSWGLTRVKTVACGRLAEFLRWLIPSHLIGGLIALAVAGWEFADEFARFAHSHGQDAMPFDGRSIAPDWSVSPWIWLGCAAIVSVGIALASVHRQWKPFLVSGLLGLAAAYYTMLLQLGEEFGGDSTIFRSVALGSVAAICVIGLATMLLSPRIRPARHHAESTRGEPGAG